MKKTNKSSKKNTKASDLKPKKDVKGGWGMHYLKADQKSHLGSETKQHYLGANH